MKQIDRLFAQKLSELVLCANGPTAVFDREGVKGGERLSVPKGHGSRVYEFHSRYNGAPSDTIRLKISAELQNELRRQKVRTVRDYHRGTLEWKITVARDRRGEHLLAYVYGCSVKTIREVKVEIQGRIMAALDVENATVRKVAEDFGISKSTISRLKNAA